MQNEIAHELVTTGSPVHAGFPRAIGFNDFLRALSGVHDFLVTVARGSSSTDLAPAKGCQDHATSSSAFRAARRATRSASIASRLNVRDDAYAPLIEAGRREVAINLVGKKSGIYFGAGLDEANQIEMPCKIRANAHRIFRRADRFVILHKLRMRLILPGGQITAGHNMKRVWSNWNGAGYEAR